jgi:drug/metabolite transporter (DMT)-like permease
MSMSGMGCDAIRVSVRFGGPSPAVLVPSLLLFVGVFACSTAVIFIKASAVDPVLLSGFRLVAAAVLLSPLFVRARRRHAEAFGLASLRRSILPGLVLAAHFVSWVIGARSTLAANASLIVNMVPLAMPFFLFFVAGERIARRELLATALGLTGVAVLSAGDLRSGDVAGDLVCFASMLLFALYLSLGRRNRDIPSIWLYVVPLYAIAGLACLAVAAGRLSSFFELPAREWLLLLALAVVPTIFGHSLLNGAMKHFRGNVVSVCNVGQFVFAGALAWVVFRELPKAEFWPAALLVVAAAVIALRGTGAASLASGERPATMRD